MLICFNETFETLMIRFCSDWFEKIQIEHGFIKNVCDFYEKILNDSHDGKSIEVLKEMEIWRNFKTAYQRDMEVSY